MDNHIRQLLSEETRLTVPQLGTFATHHITAQILKDEGMILPPRKQVTLDDTEQEDSSNAFQNYVIKTEQIDVDEFNRHLEAYIHKINEQISRYGQYEIPGVGYLKRNAAGKLFIENNTDYNLLNTAYGLPKLYARPIQAAEPQKGKPTQQATVQEQSADVQQPAKESVQPVSLGTEKSNNADKVWWLAMIPLIMLFIFLIYLMVDETAQLQFRAWISGDSQEQIITDLPKEEDTSSIPVDENTDDGSTDNNLPDNSIATEPTPEIQPEPVKPAVTEAKGGYMVVLGSLAKESAAEKLQKELSAKGIETEIVYNSERKTYRIAITGLSEASAKSKREELLEIVPNAWVAKPNQ
jgi:cell division septation protein DedD